MNKKQSGILSLTVIVAALGYFVDIYDLLLFSIIRVKSLHSFGLTDELIKTDGLFIINVQMIGLLIGGIIWGMLGDKKGRLSVLFGSIILYSIANICNGLVHTVPQYALARFVAGLGLAGELGAGITLVSELISKEKRGVATSMVAGIGLTGAVVAYFISKEFDWRICYFIGGGLGILLLFLRVTVFESGMFVQVKEQNVMRGNFLLFFTNAKRFKKYILAILVGLPTWYVIGILITFSKEFGTKFNLTGPVDSGKAIMCAYVAIAITDVLAGLLSQLLRSRKKTLYIFYALTIISVIFYFNQNGGTVNGMYWICAFMGFGTGFWAIFVTMAAEQFGTNLRATAATTIPNMVRGSLPLMVLLFSALQPRFSMSASAIVTGTVVIAISIISTFFTEETFGKDLDYLEV
ncbi:MAG: MFS transporter [Chitinophagaceae bacterium]|nr:MFS transporter [Chitinophagaceae bacterium]